MMCVVITVATVMLLREIWSYRIIFMTVCLLLQIFPLFLTGTLLAEYTVI
jgi:hypothetical protein